MMYNDSLLLLVKLGLDYSKQMQGDLQSTVYVVRGGRTRSRASVKEFNLSI